MHREEKQSKKKRNRKGKKEMNQIHLNYQCDHCNNGKGIQGIRYCCKVWI